MKKILFVLACCISGKLSAQLPVEDTTAEIRIRFDRNIEFAGLIFFMGAMSADASMPDAKMSSGQLKQDWFGYDLALTSQYKAFLDDPDLKAAAGFMEQLQAADFFPLLMNVASFPKATLYPGIGYEIIAGFAERGDSMAAARQASLFLSAMNAVYSKMAFDNYYITHAVYYKHALAEIRRSLPPAGSIEAMEKFYGKSFAAYTLLPGLTVPAGMAFGLKTTSRNGIAVYNLFGPFDLQQIRDTATLDLGYNDPRHILELSIHEFGHSFVNPVVDGTPDSIRASKRSLFAPIRKAMDDQGYPTWGACLSEHFVRAGEVIIARRSGRKVEAEILMKNYIEQRQFIYLPKIIEVLESSMMQGKTYEEAVMTAVKSL